MQKTMKHEKAHEYLEQVRKAENRVKRLEMRAENLRMLTTDTANHLTATPVGPNPEKDKMGRIMAEVDEIEKRIEAAKEVLQQKREKVSTLISMITDPVSQRCMILHYLENEKWIDVAAILGCSRAHEYRCRMVGYEQLEKLLKIQI